MLSMGKEPFLTQDLSQRISKKSFLADYQALTGALHVERTHICGTTALTKCVVGSTVRPVVVLTMQRLP